MGDVFVVGSGLNSYDPILFLVTAVGPSRDRRAGVDVDVFNLVTGERGYHTRDAYESFAPHHSLLRGSSLLENEGK